MIYWTKDCGLIGHVDYKLSLTRFYMKGSFRGPRSFYPRIDVRNRLNLGANACRPNLLSYVDNTCRKDLWNAKRDSQKGTRIVFGVAAYNFSYTFQIQNNDKNQNTSDDNKEKEKKILKAMWISRTRLESLRHLAGYFAFQIILQVNPLPKDLSSNLRLSSPLLVYNIKLYFSHKLDKKN